MNHHHQNHDRRLNGAHDITTKTMGQTRDEMANPFFQDLLRYGLHSSSTSAQAGEHPQRGRLVMSQKGPYLATHDDASNGAACQLDSYVDNGIGGMVSQQHRDRNQQLVGQALEDRRRLARRRISRAGWEAHVAEMAIEYIEKISWKDLPARMWCVQQFMRNAEGLGEFCGDARAIRWFLDRNIHKLIAFHAMEKNHQVPVCILRRAHLTTRDGLLKYGWFQSVLQEYQGLGRAAAGPWLAPYRAQGKEAIGGAFTGGPGHIDEKAFSGETIVESPATPELGHPLHQDSKIPTTETSQTSLDVGDHTRKRKRDFDEMEELDLDALATNIKIESTEHDSTEVLGDPYHGDTSGAVGGEDDGRDKEQVGRCTLTVLFHGMRLDDAEESEHVQVYVPRTAKGVTINFL